MLYVAKVTVGSEIHKQHIFKIRIQILLIHSSKIDFTMKSTLLVRSESPGFDIKEDIFKIKPSRKVLA